MVFGSSLFRGCRSSSDDAVASMSNADKRTTASGDCDDSWSSERSKADILDGLASKADWDAVIELVNSSKPSDWRIDSNNNNSNNNSGSNGSSSSSYNLLELVEVLLATDGIGLHLMHAGTAIKCRSLC